MIYLFFTQKHLYFAAAEIVYINFIYCFCPYKCKFRFKQKKTGFI